ncbi:MAG: YARHG domain-containing protein [Candidatus Aminicenantes bacterium]|nr:MAG: YARHG domain-containing protein [Candidatus Aminicenantes bacterium]
MGKIIGGLFTCIFLILSTPNTIWGDGAAFIQSLDGAGVIPIQEHDIRLLEEKVVIDLRDKTVKCQFILENLKDKPKQILMGFPFYSGKFPLSTSRIGNWAEEIEIEKVKRVDAFTVFVDGKELKTEFKNTKKYSYVYTWDVDFSPNERKIVECKYNLKWGSFEADGSQEIYRKSFYYITHTGALWEGKIAKATFQIYFNFNSHRDKINGPNCYFIEEVSLYSSHPNIKEISTISRELRPTGYSWNSEKSMAEYIYYDWEPAGDKEDIVFTTVKGVPDLKDCFNFKNYKGNKSLYTKDDLKVPGYLWECDVANGDDIVDGDEKTPEEIKKDWKLLKRKYLYYLRNEIFARHGYVFKDNGLQAFFLNMHWYKKNINFDIKTLNNIEKSNVRSILRAEKKIKIRIWLPNFKIFPFFGRIFLPMSRNNLILGVYRQKIFSQLFKT